MSFLKNKTLGCEEVSRFYDLVIFILFIQHKLNSKRFYEEYIIYWPKIIF